MGPLFGFSLYGFCVYLTRSTTLPLANQVLGIAAQINFYWTVLNVLPVIPLDGGQLVRIVLQGIWGIRGLKAACLLSIAIGALFVVGFIMMGDMLIASLFALFAYESWRLFADVKFLKDHDADITLQRLLTKGEKARERGDVEEPRSLREN